MEISSAILWWEESQLRALVLSSAFLQLFLFFTGLKRVLHLPSLLKSCIWLAYLGSDTIAIYALATLLSHHKASASGSILELLWAPVLLIHLGGPVAISAYNMEDNELWRRHILALLSQVSVAVYVFCMSWPLSGDRLLLSAAVLLFTIGIIKFSMKPWALKRASINSLAPSYSSVFGTSKVFRFFNVLSKLCAMCTSDTLCCEMQESEPEPEPVSYGELYGGRLDPGLLGSSLPRQQSPPQAFEIGRLGVLPCTGSSPTPPTKEAHDAARKELLYNLNDISLEEYAQKAKTCVEMMKDGTLKLSKEGRIVIDHLEVSAYVEKENPMSAYGRPEHLLLADRLVPYCHRLNALQNFLEYNLYMRLCSVLDNILSNMFRLLYTKQKVVNTCLGISMWCLTLALSFAAIGLFAKAPKDGYNQSDVKVTYILLCWIAAMEVLHYACLLWVAGCQMACSLQVTIKVAQHNIMSFVARKKRPTRKMMLAAVIGWDDYVNRCNWHFGHPDSYLRIIVLVKIQLEQGWKEYIHDAASFRRFNDRRGQWTLRRRCYQQVLQGCQSLAVLRSSLQVPFDRSVLLWHIATDLCFHHPDTTPSNAAAMIVSREISNYMAYLLILRPEMLMPGTMQDLFTIACEDFELMLQYDDKPPLDEKGLAQDIIRKARRLYWLFEGRVSPILWEACKLAEALMQLGDEKERWCLIEDVWVEMLCYSASRCRGYLHAKSLGQGRELLSYVWLLLSKMGMDTFADRFHRPEAPEEEEAAGDGLTSQPQEVPPSDLGEITTA